MLKIKLKWKKAFRNILILITYNLIILSHLKLLFNLKFKSYHINFPLSIPNILPSLHHHHLNSLQILQCFNHHIVCFLWQWNFIFFFSFSSATNALVLSLSHFHSIVCVCMCIYSCVSMFVHVYKIYEARRIACVLLFMLLLLLLLLLFVKN